MSSHPANSAHVRSVAEGLYRLDLPASIQIQMMGRHLAVGAVAEGLDRLVLPPSIQIQMMAATWRWRRWRRSSRPHGTIVFDSRQWSEECACIKMIYDFRALRGKLRYKTR